MRNSKQSNIFGVILFALTCTMFMGCFYEKPRVFIGQQVSEISTFYAPAGGSSATSDGIAWFGDIGDRAKALLLVLVQAKPTIAEVNGHQVEVLVVKSGVEAEVWVQDIAESLFPDNEFYLQSRDDSPFLEGSTVHLPEAGANPSVVKNRTVLPATATKRTDTEHSYTVDEFTTDPVILGKTESEVISYDKRQSILMSHLMTLRTRIADNFAHIWAPSGADNIVRTTGTARGPLGAGQTGNRKPVIQADLANLARIMDNMDVPNEGRILLIDGNLYNDIRGISGFMELDKIGSANLIKGQVGEVMGFKIFKRSRVVRYDNTGTPVLKAYGAANAATDNLAALAWHPSFVRRALGSGENGGIHVFVNEGDPLMYGDVFSALVRAGGKIARTDQKGVLALIETAA